MKSSHLPISNLPPQSASLDVWDKKYRLKTKDGVIIDQTITETYQRVALTLAALENNPAEWQEHFLSALENGAIPGGRIIANAGAHTHKPATSTINCTVSGEINDSMESILTRLKEAGLTLRSGSGIGYEFSTLRPRGAYVSGAGAQTSGPLSFMDIYDKMCFTISSAGGRRGAQMATFDISHPDILEFVRAKREAGRLRQFNLSVLISDKFMASLASNQDWPLVFNGKEYRRESAQKIWDLIMRSTYEYAEPGIIFIDTVNKMNNLWWCENIRATNPCVTDDTWVQTSQGAKQVSSLLGKPIQVLVDGKLYHSSAEGFFKTAVKEIVKLKTKEGFNLRLTSDHKVKKIIYQTRYNQETEWCEVNKLKFGDKVLLNNHRAKPYWEGKYTENQGYLIGFLIGDGTLSQDRAILSVWENSQVLNLGIESRMARVLLAIADFNDCNDFNGWRKIKNEYRLAFTGLRDLAYELGMSHNNKNITPLIESASSDFYKGFLQGLFDTDGSVQGSQEKGVSIRLSQSNPLTLEAVQRMLLRLGIYSKIYYNRRVEGMKFLPSGKEGKDYYRIKSNHELVISSDNLFTFQTEVNFNDFNKLEALKTALSAYKRQLNREVFTATVESITLDGIEDVFDVQVPGINTFDANGFHAHNCGEIPLPPYGSCLLGSIDLTKFIINPFSTTAYFDFEKYRNVISIFTRMLDNVVEINGLPLPEQRNEIERKRRHGMGYLGLGSAMTMLKIKYGSPESLKFTNKVTHELALAGWRTGIELAKEKGCAPIFEEYFDIDGQKITGKELLIKSKYLQQLTPDILENIKTYGCRFTHHSAIAPTGTITLALANNASNGIEPSFAHSYSRNIIKEGKKTKEQVEVYSYEYLLFREMFGADKPLPDYFVTANDIDPKSHIDVQAAAQYWIDSSISKTINVPSDYPFEQFKDLYHYAYKKGVKGTTTFRYNPEQFSGVLVQEKDLEKTLYRFTLEDGSIIEVKGNDEIEYDGETHSAANLYDALKEGYYGRF